MNELRSSALFVDLYELTMLQAYFEERMEDEAVFSLFVRRLPAERNYLVACGIQRALEYLETLEFTEADIAYLRSLDRFSDTFLNWLRSFRFAGDVYAVREGTCIFPNEPLLEVVAPITHAQLVETIVMNAVHVETVLASKASRVTFAAGGRKAVDFGSRRTHGVDAGLAAARALFAVGGAATSNLLAGKRYGIPVTGTMAHSFIQAHDDEFEAFRRFAQVYPDTVLLVDTYDTLEGVRKVIALSRELGDDFRIRAIRLDSGDLAKLAGEARSLLDEAGLEEVDILVSGGLDEDKIADIVRREPSVAGFGIGTSVGVSSDAPGLDIAYKLASYAGKGRLKLSSAKKILPGRKQVFRAIRNGQAEGDTIARAGEELGGEPLLRMVMSKGVRTSAGEERLEEVRSHHQDQLSQLPEAIQALAPADPPYSVEVSDRLREYQEQVEHAAA